MWSWKIKQVGKIATTPVDGTKITNNKANYRTDLSKTQGS